MTYSTITANGLTIEQTRATLTSAVELALKACEHDHRSRMIYDADNGELLTVVRMNFRNNHARAIRQN